jgi:RHS repeat-associated protein
VIQQSIATMQTDFIYDGTPRCVPSDHKFTGKERDSEPGLDNFGARYNSSSIGRFMTPNWSARPTPVPFADLANPQSLNLCSYVQTIP